MASMKLSNPCHSYGSNQSKLSHQYQHQEYNMSQSCQSHRSRMGSSMHAVDQFDRACSNNSTRYHAHANSVLPSPSIHVQESNHVAETLKRQESHTDQQWVAKNETCPNLAHSGYSAGGAMYDGAHRIGKIERAETLKRQESLTNQQWAAKNETCPIPAPSSYSAGGAMYDDAYRIGKVEHGSANKSTQFASSIQANHHGKSMFGSHDGKSYKYNANTFDGECLSPMKANHHGQTMIKEQAEQSYNFGENSVEGDWTTKPHNYSGSNQFDHSTQNKYKRQDHHGWNDQANKFYNSGEMGHSDHAIHQEGLMLGSKDQSWASSPTHPKQSSMHKSHYMTENMDHTLMNSPTRANSSTFNMHKKEDHMLGEIDGGLGMKSTNCSNAIQANQYGQSMYKGQGKNAYSINDHGIHGRQSKYSGHPYQYGSSNTMYSGQEQYGQSIYHGSEEDVFNCNDRDIQSDCINNLGHKQYDYSSNNMHKGHEQYGSMMNHSGHSAYSKHHEYEDENVDDIMDEILSKYPAHNVSSGYGSCGSRPKQGSYASSTSSSSAKKFEMRSMMNNGGFYNNGIGNHCGYDY